MRISEMYCTVRIKSTKFTSEKILLLPQFSLTFPYYKIDNENKKLGPLKFDILKLSP